MKPRVLCLLLCLIACVPASCRPAPDPADGGGQADASAPPPTNRVDIPPSVRQNLGVTFARVERRFVARTLRVPGRFELLPTARREYVAAIPGRIELLVGQFDRVEAGTPLYRIDSPRWREMQRELTDAEAALRLAQAGADSIGPLLEAHEAHHAEIQKAVELWSARAARLEQLSAAGAARGDEMAQAVASLVAARSDLAETLEKEAALGAKAKESAAALDAARMRLAFLHEAAATMTGLTATEMRLPSAPGPNGEPRPRWATIGTIEVRALAPGVVERLDVASGGMVDQHGPVLTVVQPEQVRFHAVGLQSDLPRLADGQAAVVIAAQERPPGTAGEALLAPVRGTLTMAPTADPDRRTIGLMLTPETTGAQASHPAWVRAGVAAFLEIVTDGAGGAELAIPLRCVARDGTQAIIFRRDPANPDKVIRMEADLGLDDGRWVVIQSGVAEGNEVVLDGVYQLMVATSGNITKGGHFHPDGTFHEGDE